MKVARKVGMWLVVVCMLVSSLSFTAAFADAGESSGTDFTAESGSYSTPLGTGDDCKIDNWHILNWLTDKPSDITWDYAGNHAMSPVTVNGVTKPYIFVTGGVAENSAITKFVIDVTWKYENYLKVYGSQTIDGTWTEITNPVITSNGILASGNGNLNQRATYTIPASDGYRYIKVEVIKNGTSDYMCLVGQFSFNWEKNPIGGVAGSYSTPLGTGDDCKIDNWHILNWLTDKPSDITWDYAGNHAMGPVTVNGVTKPYIFVTGGVAENSAITKFVIDVTGRYENYLKVYGSQTIDGTWTEITNPVITSNGILASGNGNLNQRATYTIPASDGYRYIKVEVIKNGTSDYMCLVGQFSFEWNAVASATVDYSYNSETKELSATVKLYNQPEVNPFIVLAGYNREQLKSVSYREIGTVSGTKTFNYKIDASEITSARVYLWDAATYAPIETFASYTAN